MGAFDVPLDVLAFDHSRVGPVAADRVETSTEFTLGVAPDRVSLVRGENRSAGRPSVERGVERW